MPGNACPFRLRSTPAEPEPCYRICNKYMKCIVKIAVSTAEDYTHIDDVVYYRSGMSPDFIGRWLWYFEYLAARVKVANPRRKVEFYKGPQEVKLGQEWHEFRRLTLMKSRNRKLIELQRNKPSADLFGFAKEEHARRIGEVQLQLELLARDKYPIPDFPEYINKLKSYI